VRRFLLWLRQSSLQGVFDGLFRLWKPGLHWMSDCMRTLWRLLLRQMRDGVYLVQDQGLHPSLGYLRKVRRNHVHEPRRAISG